jgi:hypothetical protein
VEALPYGKKKLTPLELCRARSVLKRTTWTFLGSLPGYESDDDPTANPPSTPKRSSARSPHKASLTCGA